MKTLNVGVVGYCPPTEFNVNKARRLINKAYDVVQNKFKDFEIQIVSGLTNVGVLKIGYEEAVKRGWKTYGVACEKAKDFELFPVDDFKIIGKKWGDESQTFLDMLNVIIRIGGGEQSIREVKMAKEKKIFVIEYALPTLN